MILKLYFPNFQKIEIFPFFVLLLLAACTESNKPGLPERVEQLDHLTIYSSDEEPAYEIIFEKEQVFSGDADEVLIGRITATTVDKKGRVFIGDNEQKTIHVFNSDGDYVSSLGQEGSGPGEYRTIGTNMKIANDKLYIYDPFTRRISLFLLDSLSFLSAFSQPSSEGMPIGFLEKLFVTGDGNVLVGIGTRGVPDRDRFIKYFYLDETGSVISGKVLEQQQNTIFQYRGEESTVTMILPFRPEPLIALSVDDQIYTTRTDMFLIKVHDKDGRYRRAFYYPFENKSLDRAEYIAGYSNRSSAFQKAVETINYPDTWPALNDMLIDDENRLWISTIVEDDEIYEWWVLKDTGELLARFDWSRNKEIKVVKNDKLYTEETDKNGLARIVRYSIEMREKTLSE